MDMPDDFDVALLQFIFAKTIFNGLVLNIGPFLNNLTVLPVFRYIRQRQVLPLKEGRMSKNIRILLVDDNEDVIQGLQQILAQEEDMEIVGQCANGKEALIKAATHSPNIILMDIKMPIIDGLDTTHLLSKKGLSCSVIVLSLYDDYLAKAIEAGARGYLIKGMKRNELTQAIRRVYQGEIVIDESVRSRPVIERQTSKMK
jgi:CheY-like chemotaxis protein